MTYYSPVVTIKQRIEIGKGALAYMQSTFFYIHDTKKKIRIPVVMWNLSRNFRTI